jgi:hypothetical protein
MSKATKTAQDQLEAETEQDDFDIEDSEDDYGFIIGPDGELKHMFSPDGFELTPPTVVKKILKIFGIKDINSMMSDDDTLH